MLIDASHPEETRVVVTRGNRIEEFDFESESKKQLKGNIYLARVTRVEPSLQAAFVEYGGNRHGFLAFSEIHPDYYQIPVADRQALLAADAEADLEDEEEEAEKPAVKRKRRRGGRGRGRATTKAAGADNDGEKSTGEADEQPAADHDRDDSVEIAAQADGADQGSVAPDGGEDAPSPEPGDGNDDQGSEDTPEKPGGPAMAAAVHADVISEALPGEDEDREQSAGDGDGDQTQIDEDQAPEEPKTSTRRKRRPTRAKRTRDDEEKDDQDADDGEDGEDVESVGAEDALEELPNRRRPVRRQYKIQEVIKRRQILLVQVVKEERGNKGAALTTYLSLAGRYSVLMPNTGRGGGISRKITNLQDRKRLKSVVKELDVPQGMGVILRTAGANRTKAEIKRDYEYLMRLWMTIRNLTLESTAPALVHEEGSLIKRSVRDLYNKDIDEIQVAGDEGYREAKDFMRMLMPSHAKVVQPYKDSVPIFARSGIEAQLDRMLQPQVTLKSGGYIIINQTEALVAIDVNSGRSTREHSIEDTALQTNLEAAEEVSRQLRLRDLAGLVVIDFIDMEEKRNNRSVEKRLKDCLKHDRARIQVGRISHFGLLEMSRQRIRASVLESTMQPCDVCHGTGYIRSASSVALHVVRGIEEHLTKDSSHDIVVKTPAATALYVLNNKRANLTDLEERFGLSISIEADETLGAQHFQVTKGALAEQPGQISGETPAMLADDVDAQPEADNGRAEDHGDENSGKKRRRRRRRKPGKNDTDVKADSAVEPSDEQDASERTQSIEEPDAPEDQNGTKKRRRGRRGGKKGHQGDVAGSDGDAAVAANQETDSSVAVAEATGARDDSVQDEQTAPDELSEPKPKRPRRRRGAAAEKPENSPEIEGEVTVADASAERENEPDDAAVAKKRRSSKVEKAAPAEPVVTSVLTERGEDAVAEQPRKEGWWKRKGFF